MAQEEKVEKRTKQFPYRRWSACKFGIDDRIRPIEHVGITQFGAPMLKVWINRVELILPLKDGSRKCLFSGFGEYSTIVYDAFCSWYEYEGKMKICEVYGKDKEFCESLKWPKRSKEDITCDEFRMELKEFLEDTFKLDGIGFLSWPYFDCSIHNFYYTEQKY